MFSRTLVLVMFTMLILTNISCETELTLPEVCVSNDMRVLQKSSCIEEYWDLKPGVESTRYSLCYYSKKDYTYTNKWYKWIVVGIPKIGEKMNCKIIRPVTGRVSNTDFIYVPAY